MLEAEKGAEAEALETVTGVLPVLLSVTTCAEDVVPTSAAAKVKLPRDTEAEVCKPMPLRVTVLFPAWVEKVTVPAAAPMVLGVKVTLAVQEEPTAKEVGQL